MRDKIMRDKIDQFFRDIEYFENLGIGFREVLEIVCYNSNEENPINKWLLKLDSQVMRDGTLQVDLLDMFILNGLADEIGEKLVKKLIGKDIYIPPHLLRPSLKKYQELDRKTIDFIVYVLSGDIMILIRDEILKDKN